MMVHLHQGTCLLPQHHPKPCSMPQAFIRNISREGEEIPNRKWRGYLCNSKRGSRRNRSSSQLAKTKRLERRRSEQPCEGLFSAGSLEGFLSRDVYIFESNQRLGSKNIKTLLLSPSVSRPKKGVFLFWFFVFFSGETIHTKRLKVNH